MLHALLEYAARTDLTVVPGFKPKRIRWLLQFTPTGEYIGLIAASEDRKGREFPNVPDLQFTGEPLRQFLVDTAEYALLYGEDEPDDKLLAKHGYFLDRLRDAAEVEPFLGRIAAALTDPATRQRIHADLDQQSPKAKSSDNVTFVEMTDRGPRLIVEQSTWHHWWGTYWPDPFVKKDKGTKAKGKTPSPRMRCFLSGELVMPARIHPKIKGLGDVGGTINTTLVGFDKRAFRSYGLEQSANAAVSIELAERYAAALNKLIAKQSKRLAGAKVVYWYTHDIPAEQDPLAQLIRGLGFTDDESPPAEDAAPPADDVRTIHQAVSRARELLEAIHAGRAPSHLRDCQYRALTLSGNAGRVVVRAWMEGQFQDLAGRVTDWFDHLAIVHRNGDGLAKPPKFLAVLGAMVRDLKEVSPPLETALWHSAVAGAPIPFEAMARTLARVRIDVINDNPANHARMGLLKAYLIRKEICQMTPEQTDDLQHPAYVCGQIMAVLAAIQRRALGDVGAGVVQRYYAAASATPALVLGRLVRLAQTGHLPKIDHKLRYWYDNQLAQLWLKLRQAPPSVLDLEGQTLFAMGYYHQKATRPSTAEESAPSDRQ